ncbi:MAG: metal ABC transporter ATP-binding protein [Planctomycetia bacterium]|nr:metal ABC transporter ATP-binding protein [Planctomycetia bacterium]
MHEREMIVFDHVTYYYGSSLQPALQDVTLRIPRGEFASIIGPNGGGKSTFIKLLLGLLKPQSGAVKLFGDQPEKTRYRVGYAPQQARVDFRFPISVLDVTLAGRFGVGGQRHNALRFRTSRRDKEIAMSSLEKMGVARLARKSFGDLSGGERQRTLIARALCSEPELLVLDEPTNNIDPLSVEKFYQLLETLRDDVSILMASHDLGVVSNLVDSVVCVNRVARFHPTSEFNGDLVRELYHSDVRLVRHDHRCSEAGHEHRSDVD